jgi:hypothetical protein
MTIQEIINAYIDNKLNSSDNFKQFALSCGMYLSSGDLADMWVEKWSKYSI